MSKKQPAYNFDLTDIVLFFIRNWKALAVVSGLAAVAAVIFTMPFFIKPLYESKASFYPGNTNSVSVALFYSIRDKVRDPLQFAELEVTEQYLQLLNSDELKGRIIKKYNLLEHYGLNPESKGAYQSLARQYNDKIKVSRTDFNSIDIIVRDHDPEKAAELANGIMYMVDGMKKEMQGRVAKQALTIIERAYTDKINLIDSLKQRMKELGAEGVYDLANQAKGISEVLGKGQNNQFTEKEKQKLATYGGEVLLLNEMIQQEAENITFLRTKYEQAKLDVEADLSNLFIINYAGPSYDKVYPKRSIMLVISVLSAFAAACVFLLAMQQVDKIKRML
ncbi:MAG: Wzz/FepE/Etk N-terminal domain-containing protein [Bacteroidota bacterium]|jgi:tyrosine-protein kinase Etk/Wzc